MMGSGGATSESTDVTRQAKANGFVSSSEVCADGAVEESGFSEMPQAVNNYRVPSSTRADVAHHWQGSNPARVTA